jgi:ribA/ribD-fused uncharacterized protein
MDKIIFCKLKDPYGEFSNFYPISISVDLKEYKSSEHYYQSKKYEGTEWEDHIRSQDKPYEAAREGRRKDLPLREDWENVKLLVMRRALVAKFKKLDHMKNLLLSTGNAEIVEYSKKDYFWGRNEDGAGYNMLGKLLMELREEIKNEENRKEMFF